MQAVNYYLVVDPIKEKDKKVGGLLISETIDKDNRYLKGRILTKGNLVEGVHDGDIIHYDKHAGHSIYWKDNTYEVIKAQDIVLVE
jgi:co-chaperonin GroES (HSP10)